MVYHRVCVNRSTGTQRERDYGPGNGTTGCGIPPRITSRTIQYHETAVLVLTIDKFNHAVESNRYNFRVVFRFVNYLSAHALCTNDTCYQVERPSPVIVCARGTLRKARGARTHTRAPSRTPNQVGEVIYYCTWGTSPFVFLLYSSEAPLPVLSHKSYQTKYISLHRGF